MEKVMTTPVVFFHLGFQEYLKHAVKQAALENSVILIGDKSNKFLNELDNVRHYDADMENCKFSEYFKKSYKHLSTGGFEFELVCFLRWAAICRISKKIGLDTIFHSDSDNLV